MAKLREIGADSFVIYPLLLMNNVELADKQLEYGLVIIPDPDPNSEAEIVMQTGEVSAEMYRGANAMSTPSCLFTFSVVSGVSAGT